MRRWHSRALTIVGMSNGSARGAGGRVLVHGDGSLLRENDGTRVTVEGNGTRVSGKRRKSKP